MHKFLSPVLIPGALTWVNELDLASQAEEVLDDSQAAVLRAAQTNYRLSCMLSESHNFQSTQWHVNLNRALATLDAQKDILQNPLAAGLVDLGSQTRIFLSGKGYWPPGVSLLSSEAMIEVAPSRPSEPREIDALRQEVDDLKKQVTVLTGLVQLRAAPKADPLAAAKSRGASYMKTEFEHSDNLALAAASEYSGRSDRMINLERNRGALYALILEGNTRGYRYPKWQFDVPSARLRSVLDVLTSSPMSCWSIHNFLTRPHAGLDDRSPSAAIGDSEFPIERIVEVARYRVDQQQGAS